MGTVSFPFFFLRHQIFFSLQFFFFFVLLYYLLCIICELQHLWSFYTPSIVVEHCAYQHMSCLVALVDCSHAHNAATTEINTYHILLLLWTVSCMVRFKHFVYSTGEQYQPQPTFGLGDKATGEKSREKTRTEYRSLEQQAPSCLQNNTAHELAGPLSMRMTYTPLFCN